MRITGDAFSSVDRTKLAPFMTLKRKDLPKKKTSYWNHI
jgi:hypothetical protein